MKTKSVCMFCMKSHKVKPELCKAKGDIIRVYLKEGLEMYQIMRGIEMGVIDLEAEGLKLVKRRDALKREL